MVKNKEKRGKKGEKKGITPRNSTFIDIFINTGVQTQSYIDAGYSANGAEVSASKLLRNPKILEEIEKRRLKLAVDNNVTASRIIKEHEKIAFLKSSDVFEYRTVEFEIEGIAYTESRPVIKAHEDLSEAALASVSSIKQGKHGIEIKLYDKQKSLDALGSYVGLSNEAEIKKARAIKDGDKGSGVIINTGPTAIIIEGVDPDEIPE